MDDEVAAMGAPMKLEIGGKEYTFSQLTKRDSAELKSTYRGRQRSKMLEMATGLVPAMQAEIVKEATRIAMTGDGGFRDWQFTEEGVGEILLLSLRRNHPEIKTAEDAFAIMSKIPEGAQEDIFGEVTGFKSLKN